MKLFRNEYYVNTQKAKSALSLFAFITYSAQVFMQIMNLTFTVLNSNVIILIRYQHCSLTFQHQFNKSFNISMIIFGIGLIYTVCHNGTNG